MDCSSFSSETIPKPQNGNCGIRETYIHSWCFLIKHVSDKWPWNFVWKVTAQDEGAKRQKSGSKGIRVTLPGAKILWVHHECALVVIRFKHFAGINMN
jgi:hypothetical protein